MPELRQNFATKEWVIIASDRAKRPSSYIEPSHRLLTEEQAQYDSNCPFCVGNEELDLEVESYPAEGDWKTRVVRNKFPALTGDGLPIHTVDGLQHSMAGVGYHEVLVDHRKHNTTLALMEPSEVQLVLEAMQRRGRVIAMDSRIQQVIFFKNHGKRAGASLAHPHCQLIGMPVVPDTIRRRILEVQRHFEETGECVICRMLEDEQRRSERLVVTGAHCTAFVLYAALSPFHTWIIPHHHRASFLDVTTEEMADLARVVHEVLRRIYIGLRDPDYNLIIRSAPVKETGNMHFHWYMSLVLRLSQMAGFELGSGMHINPSLPEAGAAFLREVEL